MGKPGDEAPLRPAQGSSRPARWPPAPNLAGLATGARSAPVPAGAAT